MTPRRTIFGLGIYLIATWLTSLPALAEVNGVFAVTTGTISWSGDFTEFKDVVQSAPNHNLNVAGLAVDPGGWVYWADPGASAIRRASVDGTTVQNVIVGLASPTTLALDVAAQMLYWGDSSGKVFRAQTDGSNQELLVLPSDYKTEGLALDTLQGLMFLSGFKSSSDEGRIQSANLNGSNLQTIVSGAQFHPRTVALDPQEQRVFWTEGEGNNYNTQHNIKRANYDGSGAMVFKWLSSSVDPAASHVMSIDPVSRHLYWVYLYGNAQLWRTELDGSPNTLLGTYPSVYYLPAVPAMTLDTANQSLYLYSTFNSTLMKVRLQSSHAMEPVLGHYMSVNELKLDPRGAGKLYWLDTFGDRIFQSNLDGSNVEVFIAKDNGVIPARLSLDLPNDRIFWASTPGCDPSCENCGSRIYSRSLITQGYVVPSFMSSSTCTGAVAGDWTRQWAFWVNQGTGHTIYGDAFFASQLRVTVASYSNSEMRQVMADSNSGMVYWIARDTATQVDTLYVGLGDSNGYLDAISLGSVYLGSALLDHSEGKIYWLQFMPGGLWIRRCNLDLTGVEDVSGPVPTDRGNLLIDNRHPYCTRTAMYADITGLQGSVEFMDIAAVVDAFRGEPSVDSTLCDLAPCDLGGNRCMGDGVIDFQDISQAVNAFRGMYTCPQ